MPSYGTPRIVEIVLHDDDGTRRTATATRVHNNASLPHWTLNLQHPAEGWPADFRGQNILDALGEFIARKEPEYYASRSRGHRAHPSLPDRNVPVTDNGDYTRASIGMNGRDFRYGRR
jgi:hypothetical protein